MTLYILNYNNYYNRIVKKENSLSAYLGVNNENLIYNISGVNFNPNDGVMTEQILGTLNDFYDGSGDYLLVVNDQDEIVSRWFIIETQRTRGGGQYNATLKRDVIVDYQDDIEKSPVFVEKATLSQSDPMIFNTENMTFNQIKKSESLLKDETGCAWIVGYMSSKPFDNG